MHLSKQRDREVLIPDTVAHILVAAAPVKAVISDVLGNENSHHSLNVSE